jgi:iron complex outermembrane recepter protein
LAYRINAARQDAGSFRDDIDLDRIAVMPSLTFRPNDRSELFVDFSYSKEKVPYDIGVPFGLNDKPIVPINTFFGDPRLRGRELKDYFTSLNFFRHLNSSVTLRTQFQAHRVNALNESIRPRGVAGTAGREVLRRRYQNEDRTDDDYQFVADVISTFRAGATSHQALIGFDLAFQDSEFFRFRQNIPMFQSPVTRSRILSHRRLSRAKSSSAMVGGRLFSGSDIDAR